MSPQEFSLALMNGLMFWLAAVFLLTVLIPRCRPSDKTGRLLLLLFTPAGLVASLALAANLLHLLVEKLGGEDANPFVAYLAVWGKYVTEANKLILNFSVGVWPVVFPYFLIALGLSLYLAPKSIRRLFGR